MESTKSSAARIWASCLGAGLIPVAPGTAGSAVAAVAYYLAAITLSNSELAVFCVASFFLASAITLGDGNRVRQQMEDADPQLVVSDEYAGMFLAYFFAVIIPTGFSVLAVTLLVFILFRIFDVSKPFGIRKLEPLPGGWGVLLDDLAAGMLAAGALQLLAGLAVIAGPFLTSHNPLDGIQTLP